MHRYLCKYTGITKNQGNMTPPKLYSKPPATGIEEMEIQEFPNKEFKIIVIKILRKLQ